MGVVTCAANEIVGGGKIVSNSVAEAYIVEIAAVGPDTCEPAVLHSAAVP